jgi:polyribonucleotide nucleotidyltransferase
LVVNPTASELANSDLDLVIASTEEAIVMVEGGANELPEDEMLDALMLGFESAQPFVKAQKAMIAEMGKTKRSPEPQTISDDFIRRGAEMLAPGIQAAQKINDKIERYNKYREVKDEVKVQLEADESVSPEEVAYLGEIADGLKKKIMRKTLADTGKRIGGRTTTEIRDIDSVVSFLPRTHGSAVFTRGETRALVVATLGAGDDEQRIDALEGEYKKRFMLHYNFPPYSVGEVKFLRSPGRREIGHGALAERAIVRMLPDVEDFPYTMRLVSDIMESNGSSSMASVCGGTLALLDAGVPLKAPVAGIAMGLIQEEGKFHILSDILGDEDHIGDMDFKVTGTRNGITALQMDIKISGVSREVLKQALSQARDGRLHILDKMAEAIDKPREEISKYAPRIETIKVSPDKIKDIIGPGGKMIRSIIADTGVKIDVEDNGEVKIYSDDLEMMSKAADTIRAICEQAEIGKTYNGTVKRVVDFGCFVEIFTGTEGLVHVSQLDTERVEVVADFIKEGDPIEVKVVDIDRDGKIRLSRKAVLTGTDGREDLPPPRRGGSSGGGRGRGNFGGGRR